MDPRLQVGSAPWALRADEAAEATHADEADHALAADNAAKLGGYNAADYLRLGSGGSLGDVSGGTITAATKFVGDLDGNAESADFATAAGTANALAGTATVGPGQITAGALPSGVTLGATQITTGALPAGVTIPAAQVTGKVDDADKLDGHDSSAFLMLGAGGSLGNVTAGTISATAITATGLTVNGNITATGTLNGLQVGYQRNPLVLMGTAGSGCDHIAAMSSWNAGGYLDFPTLFDNPPVVAYGVDETIDDNGTGHVRLRHRARNRVAFRCSWSTDALYWFAIDPGVHTLSGKKVMAGVVTSPGVTGTVSFPQAFTSTPVIFVMADESGDNSGPAYARVTNTASATSFPYRTEANADAMHWIAMEPGTYTYGRYTWLAGTYDNNGCSDNCSLTFPSAFPLHPGVILTVYDTNDSGATYVRLKDLKNDRFSLRVEAGGTGGTEKINYLVFNETR
jgi:hypothetical protein